MTSRKTSTAAAKSLNRNERFLLLMAQCHGIAQRDPSRPDVFCIPGNRLPLLEKEAAELIARDLVRAAKPDGLTLTDAGRAWAKRQNFPTAPHRAQHGELAGIAGESGAVIDLAESPLLWLHRRRGKSGEALVGDASFAAGERLRADFTFGGMSPRMGVNWSAAGSGKTGYREAEPTENALAARQRLRRALEAVGPELSGVLVDVCCFLKRLEDVERDRLWPARSAKIILSLGLQRLARHYGYSDCAIGAARPAATPRQAPVQPRH